MPAMSHKGHGIIANLAGRTETYLTIVVLCLTLILAVSSPYFLTASNIVDLLESYSVTGILAIGAFVVLLAGGIDISFAAIASVSQYAAALCAAQLGLPAPAVIAIALTVGLGLGLFNALLIHRFAVTSIIATIATMTIYFSLLMSFTRGRALYNLPEWWTTKVSFLRFETGSGDIVRIGIPIVVLLLVLACTYFLVRFTKAGRQLTALGGSVEAARRIGVNIGAVQALAYGYLGLCAAIAGLVQAYRVGQVVPNAMVGGELMVIAAAILGGASLSGGRGTVGGVMLGILILAILQNGLTLMSVPSLYFEVVVGVVFLASLAVASIAEKKTFRARRNQ